MNSTLISPTSSPQPGRMTWLRRLFALLMAAALVVSLFASAGMLQADASTLARPHQALGTNVVISEFRAIGSAGDNDEFIELFNPTLNPIDITGWNLAHSDSAGIISPVHTFGAVTLGPGQYYLVVSSSYDDTTMVGDAIASGALGIANNGGIALRDAANAIVDQVGMSVAPSFVEGNFLPPLTTTVDRGYSRIRICEDNNNNANDFSLLNPSQPQNSSSPATPCLVINEISWGGTQADDTLAQWIELYNPSLIAPVNLSGWYLQIPGKGNVPLSGTIAPNSYYLIERNQPDTNVIADLVYAFPFLDVTGDSLYLYSNTNNLVDSANSNGGPWPAGNRFASYQSMERQPNVPDTDAAWLTFANGPTPASDRLGIPINGSPRQPNSPGATSTPTHTPTFTPTRTPTFTPSPIRSVVINELGWMGTLASDSDEWIELYNPGTAAVDLTGWTLSSGSTFSITLAGVIPAGGYFILERTDDDTIKDVTANQTFSGSLTKTGLALLLKSPANIEIDSANRNGGAWPAGNPTTRCSMERERNIDKQENDAYWFVNPGKPLIAKDAADNWICGTPGYRNWAYDVTATPTSVGPTSTPTKTRTPTPFPPVKVSQVIINEFMPHPRSDWNNDGLVDSGDEFIELMNVGNASINLQGWRLDDQEGDSSPYTLGSVDLAPGARVVFFASQTGLLLSNRSDSVRVLKTNGSISDAYTYTTVPVPDQSWCRLPDGKPTWVFGCQPTLAQTNQLAETVYRAEVDLPAVCESPNLPTSIYLAECLPSGLDAWSRRLWDGFLPAFQVLYERHGQQYWIE